MRTLTLILIWTANLAFGQTAEQKALTFLAKNIYGQEIENSKGKFIVTMDSSRIWYCPIVHETKTKLKLEKGTWSSEDRFYKIVHSDKDIFVITKKAMTSEQGLFVPFDILTKYGRKSTFLVTFSADEPTKLVQTSN